GGGRHPDLRAVRPQGPARGDPAQLRRLPPARPDRHRPRPGQHDHLLAVPGHQLGHRRHLGRRRRRHGRPQLITRPARARSTAGWERPAQRPWEDPMAHVAWDSVSRDDVVRAVAEYDRLGPQGFFAAHGFGPTTTYDLIWDEHRYPPKAILGT